MDKLSGNNLTGAQAHAPAGHCGIACCARCPNVIKQAGIADKWQIHNHYAPSHDMRT